MKILTATGPLKDSPHAVAVLLFDDEVKAPRLPVLDRETVKVLMKLIAAAKFTGKKDELLRHYTDRAVSPLIILHGLGARKDFTWQRLRYATGAVVRDARDHGAKTLVVVKEYSLAAEFTAADVTRAMVDGIVLGNWRFDHYQRQPKGEVKELTSVVIHYSTALRKAEAQRALPRLRVLAECTNRAREWSTHPTNVVNTDYLAKAAKKLKAPGFKVTVLERAQLQRLGLNLLLAVNKGSAMPPKLVIMDWNPRGAKQTIALVGKGMVFDSGGLNIKVMSMDEMKSDMSGASAVLAAMHGVVELKPKIRVVGVLGLTENAIGPDAYRPSDIYTAYNGKTVEITNTDAEGRLVLADALAYVIDKYKPTGVIDLATLTGAAKIALGLYANAIFSNDEQWKRAVTDAAERAGERLWPLPLYEEYSEEIKSPVAELRNAVTNHRWGGASTGAAFLKEFVGKTPWVHLDIAPTAFPGVPSPIQPKSTASGSGVRTVLELITTAK